MTCRKWSGQLGVTLDSLLWVFVMRKTLFMTLGYVPLIEICELAFLDFHNMQKELSLCWLTRLSRWRNREICGLLLMTS